MFSHDGKELSKTHLHRLRVYQRLLVIPSQWSERAPPNTLFSTCNTCEKVLPIFFFYPHQTSDTGVHKTCTDCCLEKRRQGRLQPDDEIVIKKCQSCDQVKPTSEFYRNVNMPDGFQLYCRSCSNALQRRYIDSLRSDPNREKHIAEYRRKQTIRVCMTRAIPIPEGDVKACSACDVVQSLDEFYASAHTLDRKSSNCISCNRRRSKGTPQEVAEVRRKQSEKLRAEHKLPYTEEHIKRCSRGREVKPLEEFHDNRRTPDGKDYYCKACKRAVARQRRAQRKALATK